MTNAASISRPSSSGTASHWRAARMCTVHAELAVVVHVTRASTRANRLTRDAGDVGDALLACSPDSNSIALVGNTKVTDVDIAVASGEILASTGAQCDIGDAGSVECERRKTDGCVAVTGSVAVERIKTVGCVKAATSVVKKCEPSSGRVVGASRVAYKGKCAIGCVSEADGVAQKRTSASGSILICGVDKERSSAKTRAEISGGEGPERKETNRCVECAGGPAQESVLPFCGVASGIAAIRRRHDGLCHWRKRMADE